MLHELI